MNLQENIYRIKEVMGLQESTIPNELKRRIDLTEIKKLMAQLGKTPFINKQKPTPYDEALSLIWFLENVFYQVIGEMNEYVQK